MEKNNLILRKEKLREDLQKLFDEFAEETEVVVSNISIICGSSVGNAPFSIIQNIDLKG